MDAPIIPILPDAPQRSQASATYSATADAWAASIGPWTVALNQFGDYMTASAPGIAAAVTAGAVAVAAATAAGISASNAQIYAAAAATSAGASATLTGGLPFQNLQLAKDGQSIIFAEPGQTGDILFCTRNPGPLYLPATGGVRSQSAYPTLFGALGIQGGIAGHAWTSTPGPAVAGAATISASAAGTLVRGVGSTLYRSTDNGATWVLVSTITTYVFTAIANDGAGVWVALTNNLVNNGNTYRSSDDGLTWAYVLNNLPQTGGWGGLVTDGNGVWIMTFASAATSVGRSLDNGLTWALVTSSASAIHRDIACDGQGVWVVLAGLFWLRSNDSGATWTSVGGGGANIPYAVATDGRGTWLISGAAASTNTWRSVDNGLTWILYAPSVSVTVADILYSQGFFILATDGSPNLYTVAAGDDTPLFAAKATGVLANASRLAIGKNNAIYCIPTTVTASQATLRADPYYSYDTGSQFKLPDVSAAMNINTNLKPWIKAGNAYRLTAASWLKDSAPTLPVRAICAARDGVIIATQTGGTAGGIIRSADYGASWTAIATTNTVANSSNNVIATDGNGTWLVGNTGSMSRSTDNGLTWTAVTTGITGINYVAYANGVFMVSGSTSGIPRRSLDGGATWTAATGTAYGFIATDGTGVWLTYVAAQVYRSTDNGLTWATVVSGATATAVSVSMHANGVCLITATTSGATRRSTDRGATWSAVASGFVGTAADMKLNSQGVAVIVGTSSAMRVSLDYGVTWALVPTASQVSGAVYCVGGGDIGQWLAGYLSGVMASQSIVIS